MWDRVLLTRDNVCYGFDNCVDIDALQFFKCNPCCQ